MAQLNTYSTNKIQAMGSGSLTLIADQKISLTSTNNVVTISGNTIQTSGYFVSTGSFSSSHVVSANTLVVDTQITSNSLYVIGKSTFSGTLGVNTIATTNSNSFLVSSTHNISLVATNAGEINLTAVGDRVILTANTISMIGTASIQGNLNVSGTITAGTIVGGSPLHIQASATVTIVATTLALNATRFISLLAPTKIQSGLLAPTPTHVSGYTLQPTSYIVCATLNNTSKTFYLPANPNDGEMYFTKAIPAVGGANATLTINAGTKTYDTDPATSNMVLPTSGGGAGGSALIVYHSITNLWLVLTSFRATFS